MTPSAIYSGKDRGPLVLVNLGYVNLETIKKLTVNDINTSYISYLPQMTQEQCH